MAPSVETEAGSGAPVGGRQPCARGRAFGLDLEGALWAPGLLDGTPPVGRRKTSIEVASRAELEARWGGEGTVRLHESQAKDGRFLLRIDADEKVGYRMLTPDYGLYLVSRDGTRVLCAPAPTPAWHWQSFLIGQVLPLAAVLQGLEVLHASAVELAGYAVAFVGPSWAGKTSLAVHLVRRGAAFLTDDVVALESSGEKVLAHPGAGLTSVRHAEAHLLGEEAMELLGSPIGRDDDAVRVAIKRKERPLPLGAVYLIHRGGDPIDTVLEELRPADPRLILASSFNGFVLTPPRLINQLDVCARLSRSAAIFKATVPPTVGASTLAELIEAHAVATLESRRAS